MMKETFKCLILFSDESSFFIPWEVQSPELEDHIFTKVQEKGIEPPLAKSLWEIDTINE